MGQKQCLGRLFPNFSPFSKVSNTERLYSPLQDDGSPTLEAITDRIQSTLALLDKRCTHLEKQGKHKRRRALRLYREKDQRRARLAFLESRFMDRTCETLFALIANLNYLKYQVQQTRMVTDALRTMSEYTAISNQLREMEEKYNVEELMETIREDSHRLNNMEESLTESIISEKQENSIDLELERLMKDEADDALREALQCESSTDTDIMMEDSNQSSYIKGTADGSNNSNSTGNIVDTLRTLIRKEDRSINTNSPNDSKKQSSSAKHLVKPMS